MHDVLAYGIREVDAKGEQFYKALMNWIFSGRDENGRAIVLVKASAYDMALQRSLAFLKGLAPSESQQADIELYLSYQRGLWSDLERVNKIPSMYYGSVTAYEDVDPGRESVPQLPEPPVQTFQHV